ncbi:MAG: cytosine permease [Actinobacteria bacterium]|nr:cytosine permease [Actinomycetota bacterium]MCL5447489.1 cytosine permease [Actinomycetota bacterium]
MELDGTSIIQGGDSAEVGSPAVRSAGDVSKVGQMDGAWPGGSPLDGRCLDNAVGDPVNASTGSPLVAGLPAASLDVTNRPWRIEQNGIRTVPDSARSGTAWDLFWVWFAANIGILGVVLGAMVLAFGLNLWQSILVIAGGTLLSFALVGAFSVAGWHGRAPMMTLSRAIFGIYGNIFPNVVSWVSLVGWETIAVITGTLAMMALFGMYFHLGTDLLGAASLLVVAGLSVAFSILGQATLVVVQKWGSYLLGLMTLAVLAEILTKTSFHALAAQHPGSWLDGVLPAFSIVVAGTGLSWANAAGDYSRYTSTATSRRSVFWAPAAGGSIPLVTLMITGVLLGAKDPHIATAANPIAAIQHVLPSWMAVPYLVTAAGGLIVEADLSLYSSGLNLLNLFIPLKRYKSVLIDAVFMVGGTVYVVFISSSFFQPFESFILLLGAGLASWAGVFLAGQLRYRAVAAAMPDVSSASTGWGLLPPVQASAPAVPAVSVLYDGHATSVLVRKGVGWAAVLGWLAGTSIGLLFTTSPFFNGPLAKGIFAQSSLEILIAFLVAALVFLIVARVVRAVGDPQVAGVIS